MLKVFLLTQDSFLDKMKKPKVDLIEGLSPAISIEQKNTSKNPRSTVATVTEIYDYMRVFLQELEFLILHLLVNQLFHSQ